MMVGHSHESGVGVHRTCDLNTGKIHNTRNVRWIGKMCEECSKEDGVSSSGSSISDSTKHKANQNDEKKVEEESSEKMAEATETVDSEQSGEEEKEDDSKDSSEESPEVEAVGSEQEGKNKKWEMI